MRQARATSVGGNALHPRTRRSLRAPLFAALLSLLIGLAPDLTLAPIIAGGAQAAHEPTIGPGGIALVPNITPPRIEPALGPATEVGTARAAGVPAQRFQAALDAARAQAAAYGVTFAAVRDGQVIWAGSSGVTREQGRLAPESSMVIGSVTKTFVGAAVLQLAQEGRLDLDDRVHVHLPELRSLVRRITVRQLLDHTSGLADLFNEETRVGIEQQPQRAWTSDEVLDTLHAPWYRPGEGWAYANTNYHLLALLVDRLSGSSLESELERRFLEPMALEGTRSLTAVDPAPLTPAWATIFRGSGAMTSTASDLARWGDALIGGDVLGPASRRAMLDVNRDKYGLGIQRIEVAGHAGYGHTGLLNTYTTMLLHLPADDVTIALLVNRTGVNLREMLIERPAVGPSLLRLAISS